MILNKDQIREVKEFIHSRGFTHIEIEMEILDHMVSAVEEKLQKQPKKSLDIAIKEVHSSFGVMGFSHFEDEKMKMIGRLIRDTFITKLKSYFNSNRSIYTVLLALSYYVLTIQTYLASEQTMRWIPFFFLSGLLAYFAIHFYVKYNKLRKKSLMMANSIMFIAILPNMGNFLGIVFESMIENGSAYVEVLFITLMTFSTLLILAMNDTVNWAYQWTYERYLKYT